MSNPKTFEDILIQVYGKKVTKLGVDEYDKICDLVQKALQYDIIITDLEYDYDTYCTKEENTVKSMLPIVQNLIESQYVSNEILYCALFPSLEKFIKIVNDIIRFNRGEVDKEKLFRINYRRAMFLRESLELTPMSKDHDENHRYFNNIDELVKASDKALEDIKQEKIRKQEELDKLNKKIEDCKSKLKQLQEQLDEKNK